MSHIKTIAYICGPEQTKKVEETFPNHTLVNIGSTSDDVKTLFKQALTCQVDLILIFDCGISDEQILSIAKCQQQLLEKAKLSNNATVVPELGFVGDTLREQYSELYTNLYYLGNENFIGPIEGREKSYDIYRSAASLVEHGPRDSYLMHVMTQGEFAKTAVEQQDIQPTPSQVRKQESDLSTRFIEVMQSTDRNGSTHLSIMLASAIRALGISVALVVNKRHFGEIRDTFSGLELLSDDALNVYGVAVYTNTTPTIPSADKYAYVIFDAGTVSWFKTKNRTTEQQHEKGCFDACNVCVWSSFLTPTGQWSITSPDENGITPIDDFVATSAFGKIKFAPFGMPQNQVEMAYGRVAKAIKAPIEEIKIVGIEPFVDPFLIVRGANSVRKHIPESVAELLESGLLRKSTSKLLKEYMDAQREEEAAIDNFDFRQEKIETNEDKEKFLSRFLGKFGR